MLRRRIRRPLLLTAALTCAALAACEQHGAPAPEPPSSAPPAVASGASGPASLEPAGVAGRVTAEELSRQLAQLELIDDPPCPKAAVPPPPAAVLAFATAGNAFALQLHQRLKKGRTNLAFSPLSITAALAMAWDGARGATAEQVKKALHFAGESGETLLAAGEALRRVRGGKCFTLHSVNRLFGEKSYPFEAGYLDRTRAAFGVPLEPLDFLHAAAASRDRINSWVAAETEHRFTALLPAGSVDGSSRLVLVNAMDFEADWEQPFDPNKTYVAAFHVSRSEERQVPTMHASGQLRRARSREQDQDSAFRFAVRDGVSVLEMAYDGSDLAMTLLLPDRTESLTSLEDRLSLELLDGCLSSLQLQPVTVALPKFTIVPTAPLALSDELRGLGVTLAFDRNGADFSGIAAPPDPRDRLYLSRIVHAAFVKVDERGTVAAAATEIHAVGVGAAAPPPLHFIADRPFLFLVRDTRSTLILFMGRVGDPSLP